MSYARGRGAFLVETFALVLGLWPAQAAAAEPESALRWSATLYATNAAVALEADRSCRGPPSCHMPESTFMTNIMDGCASP